MAEPENNEPERLESSEQTPEGQNQQQQNASNAGMPEPPAGWNGQSQWTPPEHERSGQWNSQSKTYQFNIGGYAFKATPETVADLNFARKILLFAEVIALVSVFFGGVVLSSISLICAIIGYMRLKQVSQLYQNNMALVAVLKRPGIIAMIIAGVALVMNAIALFVLMPMYLDSFQTGGLANIFSGTGSTGTGSSPAPGEGLFG